MKYFLIAILATSLVSAAFAGHHGHKGKNGAAYIEKLSKKLDLSEEQAEAIKQLQQQYRTDKQALRQQHHQDMSKVLDAEQMEKYLEIKKKRHHRKAGDNGGS